MKRKLSKHKDRQDYERVRAERLQQRLERRAQAIERAKRILASEDCPIRRLRAQHRLIEEEIAERIDVARKELDETREKHRKELQALREKPNGTLARSSRKLDQTFIDTTKTVIEAFLKDHFPTKQHTIFDVLGDTGERKELASYEQVAEALNILEHQSAYGKKWTRSTVKRFIEQHMDEYKPLIGFEGHKTDAAIKGKQKRVEEYARYMRDKVLPHIDTNQKHHVIAIELNRKGIKTRLRKEWGNMSVKRLLEVIENLDD